MARLASWFDRAADTTTRWAGSLTATSLAFAAVLVWTVGGFVVGFTDTYQLIINTGTTIVTFLMIFLVQHTQNKDNRAMHLKLDELLRAIEGARDDELAGIEQKTEAIINELG